MKVATVGTNAYLPGPRWADYLFTSTSFAWLWLVMRLYLGYQWISAATEKIGSPAWIGGGAGLAIKGFVTGALQQTTGQHPAVQSWYGQFLKLVVLPHAVFFSYLVTVGELAVGVAMVLGLFTAIAASVGWLMNLAYLLAGAVGLNPVMLVMETLLILAWRTAGWWGMDRFALQQVGTPEQPGRMFKRHAR